MGIAVLAVGCGSGGGSTSPTATASAPATSAAGSQTPATSVPRSELSLRGEAVERVADTTAQRVTWADGTVYEDTLPILILRTLGTPDAPSGRRVVAGWLEDDRWQVTIYIRLEDQSTDPPTITDLRGEFYYSESSGTFEAANGRAAFALTGRDPCASGQPASDLCPLDKAIGSQ